MKKTVRLAGIAHSKLRNAIGLVGIEVDPIRQEIFVRLAKHWDRKQINDIAYDVGQMWYKAQWSNTIIDLMVGEHVIQGLKRASGLPVRIIHLKKKVQDPSEIRRVKTMDLVEMTQFMLQLKLAHKIKFPKKPTEAMTELEQQIALYGEHSTEAGAINYYASGDELDNLTKALILAAFAARPFMQDSHKIIGGALDRTHVQRIRDPAMMLDKIEGAQVSDITNRGFRRKF